MKPSRLFFILFGVVGILIILYTLLGNESSSYHDEITDYRKERNRFMSSSVESPFAGNQEAFTNLKFFPPNEQLRIIADLNPIDDRKTRTLATNTGENEEYIEYAWAEFDLFNRKNRLLILEVGGDGPSRGKLFLAFADQTNANETYGSGRYLDIEKVPGSMTIELDFNKSYNPYCAYSDRYSCPLPPRENFLQIPIEAGELSYQETENH